ncbi:hypothetical protein [Undibacterium rugosum]|uniref:Metalloprotease with PDZ domain n=2 Tax=Undibacterium TaxID=401469 RepID=A0A923HYL3_9BURK|nr:hypothetical protein [Undibacterium rugosum]MBC3934559.1 hypothetical protein [Undibacterium rugosum]MBR7777173.1 hypothetical protein [Undibacterium rugosum]
MMSVRKSLMDLQGTGLATVLALAAAGLVFPVQAADVPAAGMTIQINYPQLPAGQPATRLEVSYTPSKSCSRLQFQKENRDNEGLRDGWQALNDCARLEGDSIVWQKTTSGAACIARFAVPVTKQLFHHYQPALPIGDAVLLHTSNYAVDKTCGAAQYVVQAPAIATGGDIVDGSLQISASNKARDSLPVMLFPTSGLQFQGTPFYADADLPPATIGLIREVADHSVQHLRKQLPSVPFQMPMIAAASVRDDGPSYFNGNAQDILQLAFFNWPHTMDAGGQRTVSQFVAHEFSHRFQVYPAGAASYAEERLIHEGGAEFLRWMTSLHLGWLTPQQAAADVDDALASCLISAGQRSLRSLSRSEVDGGRIGYVCGLPAYVYALATSVPPGQAYARLDAYYSRLLKMQQRPVTQQMPVDFATMMECGDQPDCQPRHLPQLLRSEQNLNQVWQDWLSASPLAFSAAPTDAQQHEMLVSAIGQMMREDCSGLRDLYPQKDKIVISGLPQCQRLRTTISVMQIEGLPYSGDRRTLQAMVDACRLRQEVLLGLEQGQTLSLQCKRPLTVFSTFLQLQAGAVLKVLQP